MQGVLGVAQIDAIEVGGDLALHDRQVIGAPLSGLRPPRSGPVRMVVIIGQRGQKFPDYLNVHIEVPSEPVPRIR